MTDRLEKTDNLIQLPALQEERKGHLISIVVQKSSEDEKRQLLAWAQQLLEIRNSSRSVAEKSKAALQLTAEYKIVWPVIKLLSAELKRVTWDERSVKARLGLAGVAVGMTMFGGQGAGIAALGGAIGVPLWVVLGAGGTFAGALIEELNESLKRRK